MYGFTPKAYEGAASEVSTIVEILYGFTPRMRMEIELLRIYNSRIFVWLYT